MRAALSDDRIHARAYAAIGAQRNLRVKYTSASSRLLPNVKISGLSKQQKTVIVCGGLAPMLLAIAVVSTYILDAGDTASTGANKSESKSVRHQASDADAQIFLAAIRGEIPESAATGAKARIMEGVNSRLHQEAVSAVGQRALNGEIRDATSLRKASESGDAIAQLHLGLAFLVGPEPSDPASASAWVPGIPSDKKQGYFWLREAATRNNLRAQWILAMAYGRGDEGLNKDFAKEVYWLKRIAVRADEKITKAASLEDRFMHGDMVALQEFNSLNNTLSADERNTLAAIMMLNSLRNGKAPWGDRDLTPEEKTIFKQ